MAIRLADLVISGEINNTRKNSVDGCLELQGTDKPVVLNLTGNCRPDLAGRRFRFERRRPPEVVVPPAEDDESESATLERLGLAGLAFQQIGPTGDMTADRKVRVADCSTKELLRRFELGEPPPMEWKRCLYLEWYSQNGRVVIEMPDPAIEFIDNQGEPQADPLDDINALSDDPWAHTQDAEDDPLQSGLSATSIHLDEDGEADIREETAFLDEDEEEPADEYGLMPDDLQRQLDAQARETDRAMRDSIRSNSLEDVDEDDDLRELELMDQVLEEGKGEPLANIFKGAVDLRSPDSLDDDEVEVHLKAALGRMAMFGVALHICEHFTPREAYRLLVEVYCREEYFHPELMNTRWVQHYDTAESCDACQAKFEREYDQDHPPDSTPPTEP